MTPAKALKQRFTRAAADDPKTLLTEYYWVIGALVVTAFAFWIRMIPADGMQYMQALDPYMISRVAESIVANGAIPLVDVWRYFPYTTPIYLLNLGNIVIPAYLYTIIGPVTGMTFVSYTQFFPALAGAGMVLMMFFIGKEAFGKDTGLFAAFFLATIPAVMHRSSAGWFEKEPIASFFMFSSLYFVIRAWKRTSWVSGILAGVALGVSMTAWGGAKFLFLLYPLVMLPIALLNEDTERLLVAFTPTILIGHTLPAVFNSARWAVPSGEFYVSVGILSALWIRYLVIEYELIDTAYDRFVIPTVFAIGGIFAFLSPLYSQSLAGKIMRIMDRALQQTGGSDVVAGTVAENTPTQAGQLVGQLGVSSSRAVQPFNALYPFSELLSPWTFALIGTTVTLMLVAAFLLKKMDRFRPVSQKYVYTTFLIALVGFATGLSTLMQGSAMVAFLFPIVVALIGMPFFLYTDRDIDITPRWYLIIPLLWMLSTLFGAMQKSRLMFLVAHPAALMAGYGVAVAVRQVRQAGVWDVVSERATELEVPKLEKAVIGVLLLLVLAVNGAAGVGMAQNIGGSPNQLWMENLDFMRTETPQDAVILSWWDYGYWFETIGGRAAIADGGNMGHYTQPGERKINYPLADFLTAEDYADHLDWLHNLSVDYVVLDSTMIGKYSAVSQIHNRDNRNFNSMQTISCVSQNNRCTTQQFRGDTYMPYQHMRVGPQSAARILVPVRQVGQGIAVNGAPVLQIVNGPQAGATARIENFCSPQGIISFNTTGSSTLPGCVAWHPYYRQSQLVFIPEPVMRSTLVNLYVMDAANMPHFEEVFDNGFVKMWKLNESPS